MPDLVGNGPGLERLSELGSPLVGGGQGQGQGGPGPDTPAEQQALQKFKEGSEMIRQAANLDPSVKMFVDQALQKLFTDIMSHYGLDEEAKLALGQAQLGQKRNMQQRVLGQGPGQGVEGPEASPSVVPPPGPPMG